MDETADDSRERAKRGREMMEYRECLDGILADIRDEANAGNNKTTIRITERVKRLLQAIIEALVALGYEVEIKEPYLHISWKPQEGE